MKIISEEHIIHVSINNRIYKRRVDMRGQPYWSIEDWRGGSAVFYSVTNKENVKLETKFNLLYRTNFSKTTKD